MVKGRILLASSYGLPEREVVRAFEQGIHSFFWGAIRRADFGRALRHLAKRHRDEMAIVIQSFTRTPALLRPSVELARLRLGVETIDVVGLGFWNEPPPPAMVAAAERLKTRGLVKKLVVSCHARRTFEALLATPAFDGVMVRYNAAHLGAEEDVFPHALAAKKLVWAYTATRWGTLLTREAATDGDVERTPTGADCYRFVLSHPAVTACLAGPKDARELDGVLEALAKGPMNEDELTWMRRVGAQVRARSRIPAPPRSRLRAGWEHARGMAKELRERGVTEALVSRFNR